MRFTVEQDDFGAGIHRGREAPRNAVYDGINALIDDEGQMFRRGGSEYLSTSDAGEALLGLSSLYLARGLTTLLWGATKFMYLDGSEAPVQIPGADAGDYVPTPFERLAVLDGIALALRDLANGSYMGWAGSSKSAVYSTGSASATLGSDQVTGAGTTWTTNVDAGMIFAAGAGSAVVKSVQSNTLLTLTRPWVAPTVAAVGYTLSPLLTSTLVTDAGVGLPISAKTVAGQRLWIASEGRVFASAPSYPFVLNDTFVDIPGGGRLTGLEGLSESVMVFTTAGVYVIDNVTFDPIDGAGNVQWTVRPLNELILWGDPGVAQWRGAVVAPCVDDVWLVPPVGEPIPVGGGIKPLYRSYVKAGYQPGTASVHRGHYKLPIVNGTALVDELVCRLDRPYGNDYSGRGWPWTRWAGHASGVAGAQRIGSSTRSPKLLGVKGQRVTDLSDCFAPSVSNIVDADTTVSEFDVISRDLPTGRDGRAHVVRAVSAQYELIDEVGANPTVAGSIATGLESAAFTALAPAAPEGDGTRPYVWAVTRYADRLRLRLRVAGWSSSMILRKIGLVSDVDRRSR